jgi:hypothetical protein
MPAHPKSQNQFISNSKTISIQKFKGQVIANRSLVPIVPKNV